MESIISDIRAEIDKALVQAEKRRVFHTRLHLENAIHGVDKILTEIAARKEKEK